MVKVGTAYGALGSSSSVDTPAEAVSENEEVNGTDPVRRTIMIPRVNIAIPKDREKYPSRGVGSRTSGERRVIIIVGEMIKGKLCRASHPADPYVYA